MKLKTLALHLAYDIGSAAIGLAADKLRSGIVQRQNTPKAQGGDLQEIRDPFEVGPIKVNARAAIEAAKFDKELLDLGASHLKAYAWPTPSIQFTPGELEPERKRSVELTDDDVSAINYGVNSIYHTHRQKGPTAVIKREDLTKIYSILLKLQHKALANVES